MTELAPGRTGATGTAFSAGVSAVGVGFGGGVGPVVPGQAGPGGPAPSPAGMRPRRLQVSRGAGAVDVCAEDGAGVAGGAGAVGEADMAGVAGVAGVAGDGGSVRASARAALDEALAGVELSTGDRRFLSRLCHWDKRNALAVASLLRRARQRGRAEAGLTPAQLDVVVAALTDAFAYRTSGAAAAACWDCASRPAGVCPDHALDLDRARGFAAVLNALSGKVPPTPMARLGARPGFRRRTSVAS